MDKRGRCDHLVFKDGRLYIKDEPHDPDFPHCPVCSPASAISRAHDVFTQLAHKAGKRDGLTPEQVEDLLCGSAGGFDQSFVSELASKMVRAPTKGRPGQWTTVPALSRGLNRLFWRIVAGASYHGLLKQVDQNGLCWILAAAPSRVNQCSRLNPAESRRRSVEGDRDARTAIRWLMLGETSPAEFVRSLFEPCGEHKAEFDLHWCGWNSERGRLRAGIPVQANRLRGGPMAVDRPRMREEDDDPVDDPDET